MNASSLNLTASAHVLLNQERFFGLIDLFLLGIYKRFPSKIIFETISAAESVFLSRKHNFQLNMSKNSFNARQSALTQNHILRLRAGIEALIDGEYKKLADMDSHRLWTSYYGLS